MNLSVLRKLLTAIDSNQIPDQWIEKQKIETDAEVDAAINLWIDQKKAVSENSANTDKETNSKQADADIAAWVAKK